MLVGGLLTACGGAGTTTTTFTPTPDTRVVITSMNQATVTLAGITAATQYIGGDKINLVSPVSGVQAALAVSTNMLVLNAADIALQQLAQPQSLPDSTISATPLTKCTISGNYSAETDNTTYYKINYSSCVAVAGTTINGTINITKVLRPAGGSLNATVAFDNYNYTVVAPGKTTKIVGGFDVSLTGMGTKSCSKIIKGSNLVVSVGTDNYAYAGFRFQEDYDDSSATPVPHNLNPVFELTKTGNVDPSKNFVFIFAKANTISKHLMDLYPHTGQFKIQGANSTILLVTIIPLSLDKNAGQETGSITLELSPDNGLTWGAPIKTTWKKL